MRIQPISYQYQLSQEHIQFIKDPHKKDQRKTKGVPGKRTEQLPSYIITFKVLIYREDFSALMLLNTARSVIAWIFLHSCIKHSFSSSNAINLVYHIFLFCDTLNRILEVFLIPFIIEYCNKAIINFYEFLCQDLHYS